ncbi:sugar phosphate isomerase/epimerase [Paenibacillus alginolyticus]|uniref:sugar phosphate isomerase/epimerase family protein n=1 Tax=Paenibacillus alginolyticus TaxID=59839 RepID=UPI0004094E67|nr:TIM barrel protein [Paenibacillus alginolyticus]MCY9670713.1 sugar phosphate isomerase/epimerase [Paenibacillus alginolyticus]
MQLGMPTLIEFKTLEQNVDLCKELGLDFIELNMNLPICLPENLSHQEIRHIKKGYDIEFTVHLPEEIDLSSFHPSIRMGHLQRCKETIEWANMAGIQTLNMHLNNGIYFTLPHERMWINEQYESEFNKLLFESYSQLYQLANSLDVVLSIENTCNFHIPFISRALEMLAKFDNFHLTWDVGHDAKVSFKEEVVFRRFTDRIKHMHLHDCNDKSDHQPLYSGNVPINDRLLFAENHDLSVVIEVKTSASLRESVEQIKKNYKFI